MDPKTSSGFTLMELLLSLAIAAIIIVLIFGAFRVGLRSWERGERDIERQQQVRTVVELITHQLASATNARGLIKAGRPILFEGQEQRLSFTSKIALNPGSFQSDSVVQYRVEASDEGHDLYLFEMAASLAVIEPVDVEKQDKDRWLKLISGMHRITFEYLQQMNVQGDLRWLAQWDSLAEHQLPLAIRVHAVDKEGEPPITVIIPLHSRETAQREVLWRSRPPHHSATGASAG